MGRESYTGFMGRGPITYFQARKGLKIAHTFRSFDNNVSKILMGGGP